MKSTYFFVSLSPPNRLNMPSEQPDGPFVVQTTIRVLGGKWKLLILWHLKDAPKRYSELKRLIPEVTEKMLIQQLRELEEDGIVSRKTLTETPLKVEYAFTEYGETLKLIIEPMCEWGRKHLNHMSQK
jgi:DNA-binding HxlR family transcriptional regulator